MEWITENSDVYLAQADRLPPVSQNEIELVVSNFKERYISAISDLLESGNKSDEIKDYHSVTIYSDWHEMPNFLFRLMFFPVCPHSDGGTDSSDFKISAYVEANRKDDWPEDWICYATKFCIIVVNQDDIQSSIFKRDTFNFSRTDTDRGWQGILTHLQILEGGFLTESGDLVIRAGVYPTGAEADRSSREPSYNCRESTGFVGLQNHGATCYMNALLQILYSITKFRKSVYKLTFRLDEMIGQKSYDLMKRLNSANFNTLNVSKNNKRKSDYSNTYDHSHPMELDTEWNHFDELDEKDCCYLLMEEEEERRKNPCVGLALQNLFYSLRYANDAPPCKELMRSFGWDSSDMFTQQDSHELLKLLLDKMEEQMKGTPVEGSVKNMFEGEMETYIECIDIEFKSCRKETFEDIQLDVQGCNNIYESLEKLTEPELLSGENMYEAKGHGKQRANKGIRFLKFPPVCLFLLKRFTFDLQRMDTVKLNSRFEFYKEIDLSPYSPGAGIYVLQAVSVHHGSINSGHYYAFTKSNKGGWLKFDDEIVTKVSEYAAIGDNFGGEDSECYNYCSPKESGQYRTYKRPKAYNAYILMYVLKSSIADILGDCDPVKENPQMIERCRFQERLFNTRRHIKHRLSGFIKIRVFEKEDFEYCSFMDQPFIGWNGGKTVTFDKGTMLLEALQNIVLNLVDSEVHAKDYALSNFHIMGINRQINRFFCLADIKTKSKTNMDTVQDLSEHIRRDFFHLYDPTLYILFVPNKTPNQSSQRHNLFVIKYFDIFSENPSEENLICLDVLYLSLERRITQATCLIMKKLIDLAKRGLITPYRMPDLEAIVSKIENLKEQAGDSSNFEDSGIDEILQEHSLHLYWYIELTNSYDSINTQRTLGEQHLTNGDLLVCNFRPTEEMRMKVEEVERKFTLKEDFAPTKPLVSNPPYKKPMIFFTQEYLNSINVKPEGVSDTVVFEDLKKKWKDNPVKNTVLSETSLMFPIFDFPSFIDSRLNKVRVTFKLYNPLESLSVWRTCYGASMADLNAVIQAPSSSLEVGQLDTVAVKTLDLDVDLRTPCKVVLRYVSWCMDVDPAHVLFYGTPPHLNESMGSYFFSLDDFCHRSGSLGYAQKPLSDLFSKLGNIIRPNLESSTYSRTKSVDDYPFICADSSDISNCDLSDYSRYNNENLICMSVLPEPYTEWNKKNYDTSLNFIAQIFNERSEVVASCIGKVPLDSTVEELCNLISDEYKVELNKRFRLVDCLHSILEVVDPSIKIAELAQYTNPTIRNLFAAPLRFDPEWTGEESLLIENDGYKPLVVMHQTPDHEFFGHPFQILVSPSWTLGDIKTAIKNKLNVPKKEWDRWSFYQLANDHIRTWKSNDDKLEWDINENIKLLTEHPKPYEKTRSFGIMKIT